MKITVAAALALLTAASPAFADPLNVFGTFVTQKGTSHIAIADCGDGSPCGKVVWIDPNDLPPGKTVETLSDAKGAKIMGLELLKGFARKAADWRGGTIYDPEAGKTYASRLKRLANGDLEVKGCIGPICQTQVWTPVTYGRAG